MKIELKDSLGKLPLPPTTKWPEGVWDVEALRHGSMSLILFAPEGKDYQTPHTQDELYFVVDGSGVLEVEGKQFDFNQGDALFVKAGETHKFTKISKGLKMWAVFWGQEGGEKDV